MKEPKKNAWREQSVTERLGIGRPDLPLDHIDNGPFLIGHKPRKKATPKTPVELAAIRAKAWETRRAQS